MENIIILLIFFGPAILALFFLVKLKRLNKEIVRLKTENEQLEPYKEVPNAHAEAAHIASEAQKVAEQMVNQARIQKEDLESSLRILSEELEKTRSDINTESLYLSSIKKELGLLDSKIEMLSYGFHDPQFDFGTSEKYKKAIQENRAKQAELIKNKTAAQCSAKWTVEGSFEKGKQMTERNIKLMLRAYNGECDAAISSIRWDNFDKIEARVNKSFDVVNSLGEPNATSITDAYKHLKVQELRLAYEYQQKLHEEREEQRRIKEQIREEEKARREIEKALRDAAKEEEALQKAMEKIRGQMEQANEEQRSKYEAQIAELEQKWKEAEERNQRAISMAQQTKSGHVYIISNIGSFGENVYKIGMTRRLEPLDRVRELGDASVPFAFDVHAMIWTKDAPGLETALHKKFALGQVNKVNYRKEFFRTNLEDIRKELEAENIEAKWTMAAEAREYYESLAIEESLKDNPEAQKAWLEREFELEASRPTGVLLADELEEEAV